MSFPTLTPRQSLAKVLEMLAHDASFHASVSHNECPPMDGMPHSGIWIKTQMTTKGDELTDEAARLLRNFDKLGIFDTAKMVNYKGVNQNLGTRSEELLLPLKMDVSEALRIALNEAQLRAKDARAGNHTIKKGDLLKLAEEGGLTLEPAIAKPVPEVKSPFLEGYLQMIDAEKTKGSSL